MHCQQSFQIAWLHLNFQPSSNLPVKSEGCWCSLVDCFWRVIQVVITLNSISSKVSSNSAVFNDCVKHDLVCHLSTFLRIHPYLKVVDLNGYCLVTVYFPLVPDKLPSSAAYSLRNPCSGSAVAMLCRHSYFLSDSCCDWVAAGFAFFFETWIPPAHSPSSLIITWSLVASIWWSYEYYDACCTFGFAAWGFHIGIVGLAVS